MTGLWFLAAAYTAIWFAVVLYLLGLGRRARSLEREVAALRSRPGEND